MEEYPGWHGPGTPPWVLPSGRALIDRPEPLLTVIDCFDEVHCSRTVFHTFSLRLDPAVLGAWLDPAVLGAWLDPSVFSLEAGSSRL